MSKTNCMCCKRWRCLCDFRPYFSKKRNKEYLRKTCEYCKKRKDRERFYNFDSKKRERFRERTREYAAARRRKEGKPVRNIKKKGYGAGRVQNISCKDSLDPKPLMKKCVNKGYSNKKIADLCGVSERRVWDWKHERMLMSLDAADKLCIALETHLDLEYNEY